MSQNTKSLKGVRTQAHKRTINVAAEQKITEPPRKRGRPSLQKNTTTPSTTGTSKKIKTVQKTPEAVQEHMPVTPSETPPSAEMVPITTSNKNIKKPKQLQTPCRSNPPREVRTAARALQLQKKVAPILPEKSKLKGKTQRGGKKRNGHELKKTKEQLFQPEADVAVVDCGIVPTESKDYVAAANNNDGFVLAEEADLQYFYV